MNAVPDALRVALEQRYAPKGILGRGGMATVYLASDRKHHRDVALKVLRPDLAASLGADRFLKEIEIAARLNHPHILGLFDSGEQDGFVFYVMPYVDGGSLRQTLDRERRLDTSAALGIADKVADALGYAHRMGVFHRDIKPENILFSQGHPVVADFGIAKAVATAGGANITRTGFPLGTPGYMSPEQAAGLTDLDERTDVYSLAVVIYEMLVGEIPGRWPTEDAVRAGRFLEASADHKARLAQLTPAIESGLVRGLAIRHDMRTASPGALMAQLRGQAPPPPLRRVYSEQEVEAIVQRAAELEAGNPTPGGAMTLGGVEALAGEVGIAPDVVRKAALAMTPQTRGPATAFEPPRPFWLIGGKTRLEYELVVDGELPDTEYEVVVEEVRRGLKNVGTVSQLGRSFTWSFSRGVQGGRMVEVAVTVRAGRTRIRIQENLGGLIGSIWGGIGGGMGGGGMGPLIAFTLEGASLMPAALAFIIPAWLTITYATARSTYFHAVRRRERELERLLAVLEETIAELVPRRGVLAAPDRPLLRG